MQPERVLRFLDSVDGVAYAARLACAGYWDRSARMICLAAGAALGMVLAGLQVF